MKVSVVIPSYNHKKFIAEAIKSVLNQTFQDFEIIITDDGSSDNTVKEIEKFTDSRIKLFKLDENQGFYFAFKKCLEESSGDFIAMLSSDDIFLPNKLEKQVKFLEENKNYAAVFGFARIIDEDGNDFTDEDHFYSKVFIQENRSRYEWLKTFFYEGNCLCHPSVLIRKEFYTIDQFDPRYRQLPDFDFWIKLCMKEDIHVIQENLIKFRLLDSEQNTSGNKPSNNIRGQFELSKILNLYTELTLHDFLKIFNDSAKAIKEENIPFLIVQEALKVKLPSHEKFVHQMLYNIFGNKSMRVKIQENYPFTYKNYFNIIGKDNQITELTEIINKKDSQIIELNTLAHRYQKDISELLEKIERLHKDV